MSENLHRRRVMGYMILSQSGTYLRGGGAWTNEIEEGEVFEHHSDANAALSNQLRDYPHTIPCRVIRISEQIVQVCRKRLDEDVKF